MYLSSPADPANLNQETHSTLIRRDQGKSPLSQRQVKNGCSPIEDEEISVTTDPVYLPKIRIRRTDNEGNSSWGFTRKNMGLFLLLLALGSLIGSFYLSQASQAATAGLEVRGLTEEREHWRQENANLRRQIAEKETLSNIRKRAEELGFGYREGVEYLIIDQLPLELPDQEVSPSVPVQERDPNEPRSILSELAYWWEEIMAQFESWMRVQQ
jgi:hypothetical protein